MESDRHALGQFKEDVGPIAFVLLRIPDKQALCRLLSFYYYYAEHQFSVMNDWYTPPRLLGPNAIAAVAQFYDSGSDFLSAHQQISEALLYYTSTRDPSQLQALSAVATAVLNRHGLEMLPGLESHLPAQ